MLYKKMDNVGALEANVEARMYLLRVTFFINEGNNCFLRMIGTYKILVWLGRGNVQP